MGFYFLKSLFWEGLLLWQLHVAKVKIVLYSFKFWSNNDSNTNHWVIWSLSSSRQHLWLWYYSLCQHRSRFKWDVSYGTFRSLSDHIFAIFSCPFLWVLLELFTLLNSNPFISLVRCYVFFLVSSDLYIYLQDITIM